MQITANQAFLHGGERYEAGETYEVSDGDGTYFVNVGWADAEGLETGTPPDSVDVEIDGAVHQSETR